MQNFKTINSEDTSFLVTPPENIKLGIIMVCVVKVHICYLSDDIIFLMLTYEIKVTLGIGDIYKPCGQFFWTFLTPPPPSWNILQNKDYVAILSFC